MATLPGESEKTEIRAILSEMPFAKTEAYLLTVFPSSKDGIFRFPLHGGEITVSPNGEWKLGDIPPHRCQWVLHLRV
jgi:hypothetical protein